MANDDLLKLYGSLIDGFFRPGTGDGPELFADPAPLSKPTKNKLQTLGTDSPPIPVTENARRVERNEAELRKVLPVILSPDDQAKIGRIVTDFRNNLNQPETGKPDNTNSGPINHHLKNFRDHVALGQENSLEHNPFHELARLLFKASLKGLFAFFANEIRNQIHKPPQPIHYSPTLKEIWSHPKEFGGLFTKLGATLSKWIILTRPPLAILLFLGSSYTTYRGVNDLLQSQDLGTFVQQTFQGAEGESRRYFVSVFVGIALSSAILDFKTRLFESMANTGRVFVGIRDAFMINPRWMFLALAMTTLSVKTNYDGIVSIFSKKEDLTEQASAIKKGIQEALGNRFFSSAANPNSLFDLKAVLDENIAGLIPMLESIPNDEAEGLASSGDARKGPRYWAKHFIIFGGYDPGVSDVNLSHNTPFSQSIDTMLTGSGIDFFSSVQQKINLLGGTYANQLERTESTITNRLATLDNLTNVRGYSLSEIKRLLAIEHYQINALVSAIILDLERSKDVYQQVVEDFHDLTKAYLDILLKVDRSGNIKPGDYVITASMNVPRIEAIDKLRAGMIPKARHKNFEELRFFLMKRYGAAAGGLFLGLILFLSISMDLGDPILFSRSIARHGRRDRESVLMLLEEMAQWEKQFTHISNDLLDSTHARIVLGDKSPVTKNEVEMRFYQQVDHLDAEIKHPEDRNLGEAFILWFMGMFLLNRPTWTRSYNIRLAAMNRFTDPKKNNLEQWFSTFFLDPGKKLGNSGPILTETSAQIRNNTLRTKSEINRIIKAYSKQLDTVNTTNEITTDQTGKTAPPTRISSRSGRFFWVGSVFSGILTILNTIFSKGFKPPLDWFPLSFHGWRKEFVHSLARSSNLKNLITRLQPELQSLLDVTIPSIFENSYYPTVDIQKKYGHHLTNSWNERFAAFETKLREFEQSLLESLGMIPAMTGTGSQAEFLETLNSMESRMNLNTVQILEMLKIIDQNRDNHSDRHIVTGLALEEESQKLLEEARSLITKIKEAEEQQKRLEEERRRREAEAMASTMDTRLMELRQILNDISQSILRMKMREVNFRKKGFPSQSVMLNHHLNRSILDQAPKETDAILQVMETILQSEYPYNRQNLGTLNRLKEQAMEIQDRLMAFQEFKGVVAPPPGKPSSGVHPTSAKLSEITIAQKILENKDSSTNILHIPQINKG